MSQLTLGSENSRPRVGPLIISEVNYNPGMPSAAAIAADPNVTSTDLEFVEVHNPTVAAVDLTDWRIRGGVDFDFDNGTIIDSGATLVILSFDPDNPLNASRLNAARAHYGLAESVPLLGGFSGQLSDSGERVQLQRPDVPPPEDPTLIPRLSEDEVLYDNLAPWAITASGGGDSLQRIGAALYGNAASSWNAATPAPGSVDFSQVPGDFTGDGTVDAADLNLLGINWRNGVAAAGFAPANQRVPRAPLAMAAVAQPLTDAIRGSRFLADFGLNVEVLPHGPGFDSGQDTLVDSHAGDTTPVLANEVLLAQPRRHRRASLTQEESDLTKKSSFVPFSEEVDKLFARFDDL